MSMNTTHDTGSKPVVPKLLYPSLIVAAVAVSAFSLVGIAGLTGYLRTGNSTEETAVPAKPAPESPSVAQGNQGPPRASLTPSGGGGSASTAARKAAEGKPSGLNTAAARCAECGVVESVHAKEVSGDESGVGAVLGGIAGAIAGHQFGRGDGRTAMTVIGGGAGAYAGNEIEKNNKRRIVWETTVRMEDGSLRQITSSERPKHAVGTKVKVTDGQIVAPA